MHEQKEAITRMIEVKHLTKHYGDKVAVSDINFVAEDGEILGLLGPNGAGKSTTMNMLTGYISSTSGQALINGKDILEEPIQAKACIGYLPELPPLYVDMTVMGYLNFVYDLKKCKLPRKSHLQDVCNLCKIGDVSHRVIKHLSKGYRQRVGLAQALIGNPPILILDEPTVGLDPNQMIEIRTLIKKLGKRHTVILSSHILSEIQMVCDRVVIIDHGQVVAQGTLDDLSKSVSHNNNLIVRISGPKSEVLQAVRTIDGVVKVTADMEREPGIFEYEIAAKMQADVRPALNRMVQEHGWCIYKMELGEMTLEDIFKKITMGEDVKLSVPQNRLPLRKSRTQSTKPRQQQKRRQSRTRLHLRKEAKTDGCDLSAGSWCVFHVQHCLCISDRILSGLRLFLLRKLSGIRNHGYVQRFLQSVSDCDHFDPDPDHAPVQ